MYLLQVDPKRRLSAGDALQHAFFVIDRDTPSPLRLENKAQVSGELTEEDSQCEEITATPPRHTIQKECEGRIPTVSVSPSLRNSISSRYPSSEVMSELNESAVKLGAKRHRDESCSATSIDKHQLRQSVKRSF